VDDKLGFSWATSPIEDFDKYPIYHNAGITGTHEGFYKAAYMNKLPYNDIDLSTSNKNLAVIKYAEEILKVKEVTCLL
jgi:hypothetical protein